MKETKGIKILQVRCLLCHETLRYSREYTQPLIEHLKRRHPYINIARLPSLPDSGDQLYMRPSGDGLNNPTVNSYLATEQDNTWQPMRPSEKDESPLEHQTNMKLQAPKPSSQKWVLGNGKLYCNKCGSHAEPIMQRRELSSMGSIGRACFMLWCWPFSYLAFNFCAEKTVKLFCKKCSTYLATYDMKDNKLIHHYNKKSTSKNKTDNLVAKLSTSAPSINIQSKNRDKIKPDEFPLSYSSID